MKTFNKLKQYQNKLNSISSYKDLQTDITPKNTDTLKIYNYKKIDILFKKINNPLFDAILTEQTNLKKSLIYHYTKNRLNNIIFDYKHNINRLEFIKKDIPIKYALDTNEYHIINKKPKYKDISLIQILKILLAKHKISKYLFKDCIYRIKFNQLIDTDTYREKPFYVPLYHIKQAKKKLKSKVVTLINSFYSSLKSQTGKNSISRLKRIDTLRHSIKFIIEKNNINYNVSIKKNLTLFSFDLLEQEFKTRFKMSNSILYDTSKPI